MDAGLWHNLRMNEDDRRTGGDAADNKPAKPAPDHAAAEERDDTTADRRPAEIGGRDGPDPTRYGDWEKAGRCIDF